MSVSEMRVETLPAMANGSAPIPLTSPVTPQAMLSMAVARGDTALAEKLMDLADRWEARNARKAFDEAIAAAKAQIPVIKKNRRVGFDSKKVGAARTDYAHEDLAEIARTIDPILGEHGLSYRFRATSKPGEPVSVTCILSHRDGHSEENTLIAARDESGNKNSIQAIGSTVTYLQRYTLKAALGLAAAADDDGGRSDDGPNITEDQMTALIELCEAVGADRAKFCKYLKVATLAELPASRLEEAKQKLEAKRAKQ